MKEGILAREPDAAAGWHRHVLADRGEALHVGLIALRQWGEAICVPPDARQRVR